MREIHVDEIRDNVAQICIDAAYNLSEDVLTAFDRAIETETAPGQEIVYSTTISSAKSQALPPAPKCQSGTAPVVLARTRM